MDISLKSMKIVYWLVTLNLMLGMMLVSQLRPENSNWRIATVLIMFYIVVLGLFYYVNKLFGKAISSTYEPRFNSRTKNQLWGLLVRTVNGAIGLGIAALFLQLTPGVILLASVLYAVVVFGGFLNDGKRYDEYHI